MLRTRNKKRFNGFTFVEVVAAVALLAIMISSVLVMMNRFVGAVIDMRLRQAAFELARSNMETLLAESKLPESADSGESETNPDIQWKTVVEPFYEPYKNRMWIRAVCSASFTDSKDEEQDIELEHWITNLTAAQIKQILAQQDVESEYMDLLEPGQYSDTQLATIAYLEQEALDVDGYKEFLEQQRRQKIEYLDKNGKDKWDEFLSQLAGEEDIFLEEIGMNFDAYNTFAETYVPPETETQTDTELESAQDTDPYSEEGTESYSADELDGWEPNWNTVPKELWPILQGLGFNPPSS